MLTEGEINYLKSLQENPLWVSILKKIKDNEQTPRFNPTADADKQTDTWKYRSGGLDAVEGLISLLNGNTQKRG